MNHNLKKTTTILAAISLCLAFLPGKTTNAANHPGADPGNLTITEITIYAEDIHNSFIELLNRPATNGTSFIIDSQSITLSYTLSGESTERIASFSSVEANWRNSLVRARDASPPFQTLCQT
ncbi:hypothetical protein FWH09_02195, partial [Candidatus Saccharibacteria bacterium]|nr:hypothetical protein [Candidatus Saccharibacteria bacterium]